MKFIHLFPSNYLFTFHLVRPSVFTASRLPIGLRKTAGDERVNRLGRRNISNRVISVCLVSPSSDRHGRNRIIMSLVTGVRSRLRRFFFHGIVVPVSVSRSQDNINFPLSLSLSCGQLVFFLFHSPRTFPFLNLNHDITLA